MRSRVADVCRLCGEGSYSLTSPLAVEYGKERNFQQGSKRPVYIAASFMLLACKLAESASITEVPSDRYKWSRRVHAPQSVPWRRP